MKKKISLILVTLLFCFCITTSVYATVGFAINDNAEQLTPEAFAEAEISFQEFYTETGVFVTYLTRGADSPNPEMESLDYASYMLKDDTHYENQLVILLDDFNETWSYFTIGEIAEQTLDIISEEMDSALYSEPYETCAVAAAQVLTKYIPDITALSQSATGNDTNTNTDTNTDTNTNTDTDNNSEISFDSLPYVMDNANIFSDEEEAELIARANELYSTYGFKYLFITEPNFLYMEDLQDYVESFDLYLDQDVVIFANDPEHRHYATSCWGVGETGFNEPAHTYINDQVVKDLKAGNNFDAFMTHMDESENVMEDIRAGKEYKPPFFVFDALSVIVCAAIALIVASVYGGILKSSMNTTTVQTEAHGYATSGSANITATEDTFLYRNVSKSAIPKSNSSSGGGSSFSSGGGCSSSGGSY